MRRLLFLILALFTLLWWAYRALTRGRPSVRAARGGGRDLPREGTMVRDRVCNTFLPRDRALTARLGSEEFFFCSENCRRAFLARQ